MWSAIIAGVVISGWLIGFSDFQRNIRFGSKLAERVSVLFYQEKKTNSGYKHFHFILDVSYVATYIIRSDGLNW